jgi:ADP-ribose pyrophosphatase
MRFFFLATLLIGRVLLASEASIQEYFNLIQRYPHIVEPKGNSSLGEIEIILDKDRMTRIEKKMGRDVGVFAKDKYWLWINDACVFPSGQEGIYARILWVKALESPASGVAVMPILPNGNIVLNCNFRHATRSWEIELPRGGVNLGESLESAARRETIEETGMVIDHLSQLGAIPPDTGLTTTVAPIFMAKVIHEQKPEQEETEAIEKILSLPLKEIKKAFVDGYLECEVRGKKIKAHFRDPFLAYAVLLSESIED